MSDFSVNDENWFIKNITGVYRNHGDRRLSDYDLDDQCDRWSSILSLLPNEIGENINTFVSIRLNQNYMHVVPIIKGDITEEVKSYVRRNMFDAIQMMIGAMDRAQVDVRSLKKPTFRSKLYLARDRKTVSDVDQTVAVSTIDDEYKRYIILRTRHFRDRITNKINLSMKSVDKESSDYNSRINAYLKDVDNAVRRFDYRYKKIGAVADDIEAKMKDIEESTLAALDRMKNAQIALGKIGPIVELWQAKVYRHAKWLSVSMLCFVLIVAGASYACFVYGDVFINKIEGMSGASNVGLVIWGVAPVVGVAWVLRITSRFIMQNMLMLEDARQRTAIARTFVGLIAEQDGLNSREERALALNALFRPPVGGAEQDVVPPNFLELIGAKKD